MSEPTGRIPVHSRELRRYPWQVRESGQLLLVVAAGVWLVAAVAQTAAEGLKDPRTAVAFGALIAFGELLRLNLPGDRETFLANGLFLAVRTMEAPRQVEHAPLRVSPK